MFREVAKFFAGVTAWEALTHTSFAVGGKRYLEWADRETSRRRLVVTLLLAGSLILAGVPLLIAVAADGLDRALGLPRLSGGIVVAATGVVLLVAGGAFAFWAVVAEARIGQGTPVPLIPTQRLVVVPPFTYCRNPMVLGTAVGYLGFGVLLGSVAAIGLVLGLSGLLLLYVKVYEGKELEARFGADYLKYKRSTPFLLPTITRHPGAK